MLHFEILNDCCGRNIRDADQIGDDVLKTKKVGNVKTMQKEINLKVNFVYRIRYREEEKAKD